jgi:hypothetical protein
MEQNIRACLGDNPGGPATLKADKHGKIVAVKKDTNASTKKKLDKKSSKKSKRHGKYNCQHFLRDMHHGCIDSFSTTLFSIISLFKFTFNYLVYDIQCIFPWVHFIEDYLSQTVDFFFLGLDPFMWLKLFLDGSRWLIFSEILGISVYYCKMAYMVPSSYIISIEKFYVLVYGLSFLVFTNFLSLCWSRVED